LNINYKFSLTPPAPAQPPKLVEYSFNEFWIDLAEHWKQYPSSDSNSLNFHSEVEGASIIVSVQYFAVPDDKAHDIAENNLNTRIQVHEEQFPGRVEVVHRSLKPHSTGVGLEMSYAVDVPGKHVFIYLGYVTSRKIMNLLMVCKPDRHEAARLFNNTMRKFSAKLP
jgi:hypothetical protein